MNRPLHTQVVEAGNALYRALRVRQCICQYNVPYDSGLVVQFKTWTCARCKALLEWEKLNPYVDGFAEQTES